MININMAKLICFNLSYHTKFNIKQITLTVGILSTSYKYSSHWYNYKLSDKCIFQVSGKKKWMMDKMT